MKSVFCSLFILVFFYQNSFGQTKGMKTYEPKLVGKAYIVDRAIKGEQYFADWQNADVILSDGSIARNKNIRYNGFLDEMIWIRQTDYKLILLARRNISGVRFYDKDNQVSEFVKIPYKNPQHPENNNMYTQILVNGKVKLFKNFEVFENTTTSILESSSTYLIYINGKYKNISQIKAIFLNAFGEKKRRMKDILKSNNLSIRNEMHLIRAINIYNDMQ